MNINDVTEKIDVPEDIWKAIFDKQMELALKYKDIEGMGDLLETTENNINTAKGQKWIKDFAWRVTEELAEAYEAYSMYEESDEPEERGQCLLHFKEELIDALHFLVELTIISGFDEDIVPGKWLDTGYTIPWDVIYQMGLMCNTLKNKPWKQSQMLTDKSKFEKLLRDTWHYFRMLLRQEVGLDDSIYLYYFKKHSVNQFRQRSKY